MTFDDAYRIAKSYASAVSPLIFSASVAVGIYFGIPLHELMHRAGDMLGGGWFGPVYVDPWFGARAATWWAPTVTASTWSG